MTMARSVRLLCGLLLQILMISQNHLSSAQDARLVPEVEPVTAPMTLGEGPHWDEEEQALYFVCIYDHSINKYVPATNTTTSAQLSANESVSFIIPIEGRRHHFAASIARRVVEVEWSGEGEANILRVLAEVDQDSPDNSFNDAKADPRGRLFAGTTNPKNSTAGVLYRIDPDGTAHKLDTNIALSNGMCWDVVKKAYYYIDSLDYTVRRYDFDVETGNISNPRHVFNLTEHNVTGIADGMTIDTDGNLWVANFEGSELLHVNPRTGELLKRVPMPAIQVSSATFGGPDFTQLYSTSGAMDAENVMQPPPAGSIFRLIDLGVRGHRNVKVKFD